MTNHASDCGLHNAPAKPPTRCTCGASTGFRLFQYRIKYDCLGWEEQSRESLIAEVAARALVKCARAKEGLSPLRGHVLLRRAIIDAFDPTEVRAVEEAWWGVWSPAGDDFKERHGLLCMATALDGSPLSDEDLGRIVHLPTEDEVKAALAPWCEFWTAENVR